MKKFFNALIILFFLLSCTSAEKKNVLINHPPLHLVLALDGVSYQTMKKMYDGGYFRLFHQPAQMIATFPSVSDPNWAQIMNTPVSESYTKAYFDIRYKTEKGIGRPVGSLLDHLTTPQLYELAFDFKADGFIEHFATMAWTETSALYWLDSLEKEFIEARDREYFYAFIMNTDLIAHVQGEKYQMEYLAVVDARLKRMRENIISKFGYEPTFTLVSDHGNYFIKPKEINFEATLNKYKWNFADTIQSPQDVGLVIPEILAFASFFCTQGQERKLAKDLSETDGIHITAFASAKNVISVLSRGGRDEIEIKVDPDNQILSYKIIKGEDVLRQNVYFKGQRLSWREYFELSYISEYPNAALRLWEAFYKNSKTPGNVLASPHLGRVFANQTLKMITMVKGLTSTHGSLHRDETWGVVMSTKSPPPPMKASDFQSFISLKEYTDNLNGLKQKTPQ